MHCAGKLTGMGNLTIRKIDDRVKERLRVRAARRGVSMEEEARRILSAAVDEGTRPTTNIADGIAAIMDPLGGVDLNLPPRRPIREFFVFDDWPEPDPE
jgi:plasmid stability protein